MSDAPQFKPSAPSSPGTILREDFFKLSPTDQRRALAGGWRVIDGPAIAKVPSITKAQFAAMPVQGRELFLSRGGRVAE